jgi:hypothetical protein
MTFASRRSVALPALGLAAACAVALAPGSGQAASRTQTLRFFDKPVSIKLTQADGTVVDRAPFPEAKPGDTLDVNSLGYRGDHTRHAKRFTASTHLRCVFPAAGGPPTCESHVAIGNSMLVFTGDPGTLTNGTGIYQGATGRVISSKDVPRQDNASDVVVRITVRS